MCLFDCYFRLINWYKIASKVMKIEIFLITKTYLINTTAYNLYQIVRNNVIIAIKSLKVIVNKINRGS